MREARHAGIAQARRMTTIRSDKEIDTLSGSISFTARRDSLSWSVFRSAGIFLRGGMPAITRDRRPNGRSGTTFRTLGISPVLGRSFILAEDQPHPGRVVILSDPLWRSRFGAARNILGRMLTLNSLGYTVVGVLPPGFRFPDSQAELYVPGGFSGRSEWNIPRMALLHIVGRMRCLRRRRSCPGLAKRLLSGQLISESLDSLLWFCVRQR
jgi:hypothetical protein